MKLYVEVDLSVQNALLISMHSIILHLLSITGHFPALSHPCQITLSLLFHVRIRVRQFCAARISDRLIFIFWHQYSILCYKTIPVGIQQE